MLSLQSINTEGAWLIAVVYVALVATSIGFNFYINGEATIDPAGPSNGMYVVLGTAYTLLGVFLIFLLLIGFEGAVLLIVLILSAFAATGVPMLIGAQRRWSRRRLAERQETERAERAAARKTVTSQHYIEE